MKRNVFSELTEGFDALKAEREGKRTLRTHAVASKPARAMTANELVRVREAEPFAACVRPLPAHQRAHARELGTRARQAQTGNWTLV